MQPIYQVFGEGSYAGGWNDVDKDRFDATEEEGRRIVYENTPEPIAAKAPAPHFDDAVVDSFAVALKEKLAQARAKGRHGWESCTDSATLSEMLREHVEKGDPRDVANFCMFLWFHGFSIRQAPTVAAQGTRQFAKTKEYVVDGGTVVKEPWRLTPVATPAGPAIKAMVDRFLGWKLPRDFSPDCGISFTPPANPEWGPCGTNLLNADQARQMLEYVCATPAPASQAEIWLNITPSNGEVAAFSLAPIKGLDWHRYVRQQSAAPVPAAQADERKYTQADMERYGKAYADARDKRRQHSATPAEPVAVIGNDFSLFWIGTGPIAPLIKRHRLKVGDKLYANPADAASEADKRDRTVTMLLAWIEEAVEYVGCTTWSPSLESDGRKILATLQRERQQGADRG